MTNPQQASNLLTMVRWIGGAVCQHGDLPNLLWNTAGHLVAVPQHKTLPELYLNSLLAKSAIQLNETPHN